MSFGFILVLEAVLAVLTGVLLLELVDAGGGSQFSHARLRDRKYDALMNALDDTYRNSSSLSNFFGFLGQHSQIKRPWILLETLFCLECARLSPDILRCWVGSFSERPRWWCALDKEPRGLGFCDLLAAYGETGPNSVSVEGESAPGESRGSPL